MNHIRKWIG